MTDVVVMLLHDASALEPIALLGDGALWLEVNRVAHSFSHRMQHVFGLDLDVLAQEGSRPSTGLLLVAMRVKTVLMNRARYTLVRVDTHTYALYVAVPLLT